MFEAQILWETELWCDPTLTVMRSNLMHWAFTNTTLLELVWIWSISERHRKNIQRAISKCIISVTVVEQTKFFINNRLTGPHNVDILFRVKEIQWKFRDFDQNRRFDHLYIRHHIDDIWLEWWSYRENLMFWTPSIRHIDDTWFRVKG